MGFYKNKKTGEVKEIHDLTFSKLPLAEKKKYEETTAPKRPDVLSSKSGGNSN